MNDSTNPTIRLQVTLYGAGNYMSNIAGIPRMSSVTIFQSDHFVLSTNFLFKFNVSLPLVTGELLQNTVDVNNVTYKLYNIKLQRLPVLLNNIT